jgi:hypothetical protein
MPFNAILVFVLAAVIGIGDLSPPPPSYNPCNPNIRPCG